MSVVIRYFATAGAGAADGTSHANRAALFSAGNWSTVITGFAFNSTDSMEARIEAGSYTCSQALAAGLFTNAPSNANPITFIGADTSGNRLSIPDLNWNSCEPAWDTSTLPVIASTTNVAQVNLANSLWTLVSFSATTGRNGAVVSQAAVLNWCSLVNATSSTTAQACSAARIYNCVLKCTGSIYDVVLSCGSGLEMGNCRLEGVTGSSGNRRGLTNAGVNPTMDRCTVVNNGGEGIICTTSNVAQYVEIRNSVVANNGSTGIKGNTTASQNGLFVIQNCMVTGNGAWGIDGNSAGARIWAQQNRLRNNSSGNVTGLGNYLADMHVDTTSGTDADEYVSTGANGDFRLRYGGYPWGNGYGVAEQASTATGGGGFFIQ